MFYESTRGGLKGLSSAEAIKMGIAPDGGLFVPEERVTIDIDRMRHFINISYHERAVEILKFFLDDYTEDEIRECVYNAYTLDKFGCKEIAPVYKLTGNIHVLELWHGPTSAFKDMALQILPHLLVKAMRKTGETDEIVILVATSGDTGKAALEGFRDVEGTKIIVFFPNNGVSEVQKRQMITQEGRNVYSIAVEGNFDDAQNGVKAIFTNKELIDSMMKKGYKFSSANSINWGRLVPQVIYYFSAYLDIVKSGEINLGDKVNIVVPTGNFGNILAAYYAMTMGLPVNRLICASNENNVLTDFISSGVYDRNREFKKTISPSMDILISSNLERLLYETTGHDSERIRTWMNSLKNEGVYTVDTETHRKISAVFWGGYSNEAETLDTIKCIYKDYGYVVDTHTAVGIDVYDKYVISTGDVTKTIVASTASPFKFNKSVVRAILGEDSIRGKDEFELLELLSRESGMDVPPGLKGLDKKAVRHNTVCTKESMEEQVRMILNV
ncbi:MAG TPA: threonine synthase [Clostridiaceae bacterium]|nr:threonine synthase [Clostridiaceae bacterium]